MRQRGRMRSRAVAARRPGRRASGGCSPALLACSGPRSAGRGRPATQAATPISPRRRRTRSRRWSACRFRTTRSFAPGRDNDTANVLNIQPVVPFNLGDWNVITPDDHPGDLPAERDRARCPICRAPTQRRQLRPRRHQFFGLLLAGLHRHLSPGASARRSRCAPPPAIVSAPRNGAPGRRRWRW